jgi:hypothetical protein
MDDWDNNGLKEQLKKRQYYNVLNYTDTYKPFLVGIECSTSGTANNLAIIDRDYYIRIR